MLIFKDNVKVFLSFSIWPLRCFQSECPQFKEWFHSFFHLTASFSASSRHTPVLPSLLSMSWLIGPRSSCLTQKKLFWSKLSSRVCQRPRMSTKRQNRSLKSIRASFPAGTRTRWMPLQAQIKWVERKWATLAQSTPTIPTLSCKRARRLRSRTKMTRSSYLPGWLSTGARSFRPRTS